MADYPDLNDDERVSLTDLFNPADGWKEQEFRPYASYANSTPSTTSTTSTNSGERPRNYTFDDYQLEAGTTAVYPGAGEGTSDAFSYLCLKLNGEAGEVGEAYAKHLRGDYDIAEAEYRISKELGDVLWYVSEITRNLKLSLGAVAADNIRKLADRANRGVIRGSGDDR